MRMIGTEEVTVISPNLDTDDIGEPIGSAPTEEPAMVVVQPGASKSLDASRPDGVSVAYTLHFPKTWTAPLRGCFVSVRGELFSVVGDPKPYSPENTPGEFNMSVEVTRSDG